MRAAVWPIKTAAHNRLSCTNKGPQTPTPSCNAHGNTSFIYDHGGVWKVKTQSSPVIYPNQYYTDVGGGTGGNQFKHIFIGSERILTKKARIAPVQPPADGLFVPRSAQRTLR